MRYSQMDPDDREVYFAEQFADPEKDDGDYDEEQAIQERADAQDAADRRADELRDALIDILRPVSL